MPEPENAPGTTLIEVRTDQDVLIMNSHGALIEGLTLDGVRVLATVTRGDGKKAATHPCTPIFGRETTTNYGLPQHGPMRNSDTVMRRAGNSILVSYDVENGSYPRGLRVEQIARIENGKFSLDTLHRNSSVTPLPANFGEHLYWDAPQGWEGVEINGIDVTELVKKDSVVDLLPRNEISIPGKPIYILEQIGLFKVVLWTGQSSEGVFDKNYVCIEPVEGDPLANFFGTESSLIPPGTNRSTSLSISIKR